MNAPTFADIRAVVEEACRSWRGVAVEARAGQNAFEYVKKSLAAVEDFYDEPCVFPLKIYADPTVPTNEIRMIDGAGFVIKVLKLE